MNFSNVFSQNLTSQNGYNRAFLTGMMLAQGEWGHGLKLISFGDRGLLYVSMKVGGLDSSQLLKVDTGTSELFMYSHECNLVPEWYRSHAYCPSSDSLRMGNVILNYKPRSYSDIVLFGVTAMDNLTPVQVTFPSFHLSKTDSNLIRFLKGS